MRRTPAGDSLAARRANLLRHKLKEAGYSDDDIRAGLKAGKTAAQMLEEAALRQELADLGLELRDGDGRFEVFEAGALATWGPLSEIREWLLESAEYARRLTRKGSTL